MAESNQFRSTGTGSKSMGNPSPASNQLKFAVNNKKTNVLKSATNKLSKSSLPAAVNPGPEGRSQPGMGMK